MLRLYRSAIRAHAHDVQVTGLARAVSHLRRRRCQALAMTLFDLVIICMGLGRIALGLAPFIAAGPASRLLGFPGHHDNPTARLMARFFGVRDAGLGVLAFYAVAHPEAAGFLFLFNAAMDLGDLLSTAIP